MTLIRWPGINWHYSQCYISQQTFFFSIILLVYIVDTGIVLSNKYTKSPSPECYMTFWSLTECGYTLHWSGITVIHALVSEMDLIIPFNELARSFHRTFATGTACRQNAYSFKHLILSHFGLACMIKCWAKSYKNVSCIRNFSCTLG